MLERRSRPPIAKSRCVAPRPASARMRVGGLVAASTRIDGPKRDIDGRGFPVPRSVTRIAGGCAGAAERRSAASSERRTAARRAFMRGV